MGKRLRAFNIKMGTDCIGVVCTTDWPDAETIAFKEFGFTDWYDYKRHYTNVCQYKKQHPTLAAKMWYDDLGSMLRTTTIKARNTLRRIYQFDLVNTRLLLLFPTIEQVEESFNYKILSPRIGFWFCSDWDG